MGLGRLDNIFTPKCMVSIYGKIDLTIQREKSRDMYITRTALIHLVRNKHATYLVFTRRDSNPISALRPLRAN